MQKLSKLFLPCLAYPNVLKLLHEIMNFLSLTSVTFVYSSWSKYASVHSKWIYPQEVARVIEVC